MRILIIILLASISLVSSASSINGAMVDSIYNTLAPNEKINHLVWLKVDDGNDLSTIEHNFLDKYGAIYLERPFKPFDEYIFNNDFIPSLAVQLDASLNPSPDDLPNLPTLITLSSIRDNDLLDEYFGFLRSTGKSFGIDYMVLPDMKSAPDLYKRLIDKMKDYDQTYFVDKERIGFSLARKKKEFSKIFDQTDYWVIGFENINDMNRTIKRHSKKVTMSAIEQEVKFSISNKYSLQEPLSRRRLPNQLAFQISRASISPIQKREGILPLKSDTVCFLTNEPFGKMAKMLAKYAYLITSYDGIRQSNAPVIIDNVYFDEDLPVNQNSELIFLGEYAKGLSYGENIDAALFTSVNNEMYSYLLPQLLFGSAEASGLAAFKAGEFEGYTNTPIKGLNILGHAPSEIFGLDDEVKFKINEIITEAITTGSTPGCQIAVALDGNVVLEEGYGYLTYDSLIQTDRNTIYDLASVTKVTATLLAVMKLYEEGLINLDSTVSTYLPEYANSNKSDITIRQILSHNAGLVSYVPFWKRALGGEDRLETFYYETEEDEQNDKRSYGLKPNPILMDSLKNWILSSPVVKYDSLPKYKYSDIGFMILHQCVEAIIEKPIEDFLQFHFYSKLELDHLQFNPLMNGADRFEIAPTEYDYYFRDEQVWGQVHDRNAAVFGGVAGHAGLFSNSQDLLILLQMIAQNGEYGGVKYLDPSTISYFNNQYFPNNRRALGWDKRGEKVSNVSQHASYDSFGHTGFTGTLVWIDPEFDFVFVFLSNRIYPDANNYKLIKNDIRARVQGVIYEAILAKWMN